MALEKQGKREIRLKEGRESGSYGIGSRSIAAEAGKSITVERHVARLAVGGGHFEYTPQQAEEIAPTKEDLMKKPKDELVRLAKESGASDYIARMTKDQLADFILIPAKREEIENSLTAKENDNANQ